MSELLKSKIFFFKISDFNLGVRNFSNLSGLSKIFLRDYLAVLIFCIEVMSELRFLVDVSSPCNF
jgi:hypothetical protein